MLTETSSNAGQADRPADSEIDGLIRDALEALELEWADEAILLCERALERDKACAEAVFILGLVYFDMHEASRAIEVLELAHKLNPKRQEFTEALAAIMVRIGKVNEALYYAKMATVLERHPTIPNLLPERFGSFFKNMDHGDPNLYLTRATRSLDLGDVKDAVKYAQRQLELTPNNDAALSVMARACLAAGQFEASAAAVRNVMEQSGPTPEDLANLASALAALGHSDQAEAYRADTPDANGQAPEIHVSNGDGINCRHCQEDVAEGERYLILAHRPFPRQQPYAEIGPIFLHAEPCRRYPETDRIPAMFLERETYLLKGYCPDDRIVYGTGQIVKSAEVAEAASRILDRNDVKYVHVRSALNNCFTCRIDRA